MHKRLIYSCINKKNTLPGFMVIKIPHDQTKLISRPSNTNLVAPADRADRMDRICCATTDNTSMLIRLNSSKQPHAPVYKYKERQGDKYHQLLHLMHKKNLQFNRCGAWTKS